MSPKTWLWTLLRRCNILLPWGSHTNWCPHDWPPCQKSSGALTNLRCPSTRSQSPSQHTKIPARWQHDAYQNTCNWFKDSWWIQQSFKVKGIFPLIIRSRSGISEEYELRPSGEAKQVRSHFSIDLEEDELQRRPKASVNEEFVPFMMMTNSGLLPWMKSSRFTSCWVGLLVVPQWALGMCTYYQQSTSNGHSLWNF